MQPDPRSRTGLGEATLGVVLVATLAGTIYGIIGFYWEFRSSFAELVFPLATVVGAWALLHNRAFLSAAVVGLLSVTLFYFIVITVVDLDSAAVDFHDLFRPDVFVEPLMSKAVHTTLVFTCLLTLILVLRAPVGWVWLPPSKLEWSFGKATFWPSVLFSQVLAMLTLRGPLITDNPYGYAYEGYSHYAGLEAMWSCLVIYPIVGALRVYGAKHKYFYFAIANAVLLLIFTRLLRGERGSVVGILVFLMILYYSISTARYKGPLVVLSVASAFVFLQMWAYVRGAATDLGLAGSASESWNHFADTIERRSLTDIDRLPAVYWNLLDTIDLYALGISRDGLTYANLLLQSIPEVVADLLGYERPLTEPWVFAQFRPTGGGIFMVAEAYWNWGLAGVILLAVVLGWIVIGIERLYRRLEPIFSFAYFGVLVVSVVALLVGVQSFARALEIALVLTGVAWILMKLTKRAPWMNSRERSA